jgi:hypothetical protein
MDFFVSEEQDEFYPTIPVDDGVFLIPAENSIERPCDNELIERDKDNI